MNKIGILCFGALFMMACKSTAVKKTSIDNGRETVLKLDPKTNNPRNSEGAFLTLNDGRILYAYTHYTGESGSDWGNAYIASRVSSDEGMTWSKEDKVEINQEGTNNVMSVSLLRLQDGSIALFNLKVDDIFFCTPWMRISKDEGKSWSRPWKCITDREGYFGVNNDRIVQLESGRILMPVVEHNVKNRQWDSIANRGIIWNFYSDDNGKTWKSGPNVAYPRDAKPGTIMQEPGIVVLKNNDVLMYNRTLSGTQFLSYSKDNGVTFSEAVPGNIPSPCSPALIKRIPGTGDLMLVWNNNAVNQKRTPLSVAISKDEGKTWEKTKIIEDGPDNAYSYPAIHFAGDNVLVAYCANGLSSNYITRLSLEWIYK